ncbi:MAG: acetyl-CoA carboxylase biotin carboxyl carrier protein subunit [Oscillospiraceae bacterium]|nr:acetyl-CoA carboxylase biotin carboxyl carrier protein subunit [Oscillospiraceae bacterium]
MKRYTITVNGNAYDVTVDEADGAAAPAAAPAPAPKKAAPKAAAGAAGNASINAPMRGTIVDVKVKVGDKVTNGTVVAVLEAMKMENDIVSDKDGVVASICVNKGEAVETGAAVITINA